MKQVEAYEAVTSGGTIFYASQLEANRTLSGGNQYGEQTVPVSGSGGLSTVMATFSTLGTTFIQVIGVSAGAPAMSVEASLNDGDYFAVSFELVSAAGTPIVTSNVVDGNIYKLYNRYPYIRVKNSDAVNTFTIKTVQL